MTDVQFVENGKVNINKLKEGYIKNNFPDLYSDICEYSKINNLSNLKFTQQIWHYLNQHENIPKCKTCDKDTKWKSFVKGYTKYCSKKCSANSEESKQKKIQTVKERYGVDHISQSEKIKDKIKEKRDNTIKERYGVDNISQNEVFANKIKVGIINYYNSSQHLIDKKNKYYDFFKDNGIIIERFLSPDLLEITCMKCHKTFETSFSFINQRLHKYDITVCSRCLPKAEQYSGKEKELFSFIRDNYTGKIVENDRSVLNGGEIDIYLPYLKLAFEYNGVYWHNEIYKPKDYHFNKTNICLNNQIRLIHIYEDDWKYKKEIVKSRILNLLGESKKIYARKCVIKEVKFKEIKKFLNDNHIQGFTQSKVNIGLYYDSKLVSLMTFGGLRSNLGQTAKEGHWELVRFCNLKKYSVVGGASRLLKYFIRNYHPEEIISYADKSWSNGRLYENLGFKNIGQTDPNYFYVVDGIRENRYNFRKNILVEKGYDSNMTEHEIMLSRKIYRIYDSGSFKFKMTKEDIYK